ncbi:hypothetical protein HPP92_000133 [Vanilla planifolia]|uniref:Uncharacterized protein n=1 Tax=Vanilla planifolia TaxID=51239 RepID=A0A835RXE9_VANPL|nr:hypothetical protein HPP92_000133 [Vanilla planifolia]
MDQQLVQFLLKQAGVDKRTVHGEHYQGRLRDVDYPFVGNHYQLGRPQEVVIFIIGGTTYEEARFERLEEAQRITRSSSAV